MPLIIPFSVANAITQTPPPSAAVVSSLPITPYFRPANEPINCPYDLKHFVRAWKKDKNEECVTTVGKIVDKIIVGVFGLFWGTSAEKAEITDIEVAASDDIEQELTEKRVQLKVRVDDYQAAL